jgi:predicted CXXCH cytochrome family protein
MWSKPRRIPLRLVGIWVAFVAASWFVLATTYPVYADDFTCRGCHDNNQDELTLPSGETLPLLALLEELAGSAHGVAAAESVACTDCHVNQTRYRYPHLAHPAQNRREYRESTTQQCQQCHLPHNPFHEPYPPANFELPTCVDCHGSHTIDTVANIADQMPANCVTCHVDQTETWAHDLVAPRPGIGLGADGYVGSARCVGCHADYYLSWRETLHAQSVQDPSQKPEAVIGDFAQSEGDLPFGLESVAYTLGSRWQQQYLTRTVEGDFYVLPALWDVASQSWESYHPATWQEEEWRQSCSGCHVTGLDTVTWGFTEFGIGCEGCHGPGAAHLADPEQVKPFTGVDDQVCGACHSRGTSPDGHPFPATYRPGDKLTDHFTFTTDEAHLWPDGSAKSNNQQYMDWQLGSRMALAATTNCVTCHEVHSNGASKAQLKMPVERLCVECHSDKRALLQHTPYHEQASTKRTFLCTDCHMPTIANTPPGTTNGVGHVIHNHSFLQPNPQASIEFGGVEAMPNACNNCHSKVDDGPEWAAQTIAYIKERGVVGKSNFFGPGPTVTSPPPPTPIPSVGEPAEDLRLATGRWLRNIIFSTLGLLAVIVVLLIARTLMPRKASNA